MTLPRRPEGSGQIPNEPFSSPQVIEIRGPYWNLTVGEGLSVDAEGSVQVNGLPSEAASANLYGPNGLVGVSAGLNINSNGDFQVSTTPCDSPPYLCNTNVNPYCVTDFTKAWGLCKGIEEFPLIDVSSGTNFSGAWLGCSNLTSFPLLDTGSVTNFNGTWYYCTSLTSFPAGMFDTCTATSFTNAWTNCALDQTSVDNILVSIDTAGQSDGIVNIGGGTSATPSVAGLAAKASLIAKGWTVLTN